jgi:MFS family permease
VRQNAGVTDEERVTYSSVLHNREFVAILLSQTLSILGDQVTRIALAALVYAKTGSAFAASATFAVSYLTYLVSGPFLGAVSDRYDRRTVMVISDVGRALAVGVLAVADLPLVGVFVLLVGLSALAPAFDSARGATLPDILPGERYARGSALANVFFQSAQIGGFVVGGALLAIADTRTALLLDAGTFLISAGAVLGVLSRRTRPEESERTSLVRETAAGVRAVAHHLELRQLLAYALLGALAVSAPEGLALPLARQAGGGTLEGGLLTASLPAGFVLGSLVLLRLPTDRRVDLLPGLVVASAAPLLATPFVSDVWLLLALWVVSGLGSALQLIASAAYVQAAPEGIRARAYGLASTALIASQGVALVLAGAATSLFDNRHGPSIAIAILAGLAIALVPLAERLGGARMRRPQGIGLPGR